jgi:hypothetical protein
MTLGDESIANPRRRPRRGIVPGEVTGALARVSATVMMFFALLGHEPVKRILCFAIQSE